MSFKQTEILKDSIALTIGFPYRELLYDLWPRRKVFRAMNTRRNLSVAIRYEEKRLEDGRAVLWRCIYACALQGKNTKDLRTLKLPRKILFAIYCVQNFMLEKASGLLNNTSLNIWTWTLSPVFLCILFFLCTLIHPLRLFWKRLFIVDCIKSNIMSTGLITTHIWHHIQRSFDEWVWNLF